LDFTRVVAPVDGIAGAALLPVGGAAKANDTALVVVNQVKPIYVTFAVPESELDRLKRAMAQGSVAVTTTVPGSTTALTGRLAFLDNAVDATTGTIMAKASFTNEEGGLTPGQFAEVKVTVGRLHNAVVVPAQAVESGLDGPFVFVVKADSTVEIRPIKLAADVDGFSAVASGLAAGERVVTDGQSRLRAGMRIAGPATSAAERSP
jgi:multidrug efflux system membrane fusion protein